MNNDNLLEKEKAAVENLVTMSYLKKKRILTVQQIQDILKCKACYENRDPLFVNIFLLCSILDDFTLLREYEEKRKAKYIIKLEVPSIKKTYKCEVCKEAFSSKNGLNYHSKYVHSVEKSRIVKPFPCPFSDCIKKYKNKNGLYYHLVHHHKGDCDDIEEVYARSIER